MQFPRRCAPRRGTAQRACGFAWLLCAIGFAGAAPGSAQSLPQVGAAPDDEFIESRPFSIPDKQSARALYDVAAGHVQAGRWTEGITALERLIVEHAGSVLELPSDSEVRRRSTQPVYRGAADAARELIERLPPAARAAYGDRYSALTQELLARARAAQDRPALAELARRYPLSEAARDAWWALGDLEAEAGHVAAARAAWGRAARHAGEAPLSEELKRRAAWTPGDAAERGARASFLSIANEASEGRETPDGEAHGWDSAVRIDAGLPGPFGSSRQGDQFNLFPIVAGDLVLGSNSLTLTAVDALTGDLRWRSDEAPGWAAMRTGSTRARDGSAIPFSGFFEGLDRDSLMLAPAAGSGIAIAALQVPVTQNGNTTFQGQIRITTVIPDRRLFAFDLQSGRPLWNHLPSLLWDGDSGPFEQRMRVAGPPVIAGSRILVPAWRPQGRISYYVACYDLSSGAYLWSTQVASGQRPLNMFGRLEREFCAPPLVVAGEKVIALTQLGAVAALDLFSGEILWETTYLQIALPGADGIQAGQRHAVWRNAPPVVERGVVVVTPQDSPDMLGIDLEDGAVLWSLGSSRIAEPRSRHGATWCLLGVRDETIYLGGRSVLALRAPEGLGSRSGPISYASSENLFGDGFADPSRLPRAVLLEDHVIVPTREGRIALDRRDLARQQPEFSGDWGTALAAGMGNLAVGEGALYALSGQLLCGLLDWRSIETRLEQELAQRPDDGELAARLGTLLRERAAAERADSRPEAALAHLARAQQVLQAPAAAGLSSARVALFECLRLEARVLVDSAQASLSLERLEAALPLAPDDLHLAVVLAEIVRLAEGRMPERFESALARLERDCADLEFPDTGMPSIEAREVRRWVLERRLSHAVARSDQRREYEALIGILEQCGDGPLSPGVAEQNDETPSRRIERRLAAGQRAAWQPFEEKAREAFVKARDAGDAPALERLTRLFPHTRAAHDARDARLALALEAGDCATAVRTAFEELPPDWSAQNSTPRQAQLAWAAATALKQQGNGHYARSLLERLGRFQAEVQADLGRPGQSFGELAQRQAAELEDRGTPQVESRFAAPAREAPISPGDSVLLGALTQSGKSIFVLAGRDRFSALDAEGAQLWSKPVKAASAPQAWLNTATLAPASCAPDRYASDCGGRVLLSWSRGVQALDAASGEEVWSWSARGSLLEQAIAAEAGVLTVAMLPEGGSAVLVGLDLAQGTELWEYPCAAELWPQPVLGSGFVVLLPKLPGNRNAEVLEIASGTLLRSLDVGQHAPVEDRRAAWIEDGRLILPHFSRSRGGPDVVVAYDLDTGARVWRVPGDAERELDSIVRSEGATYLVYLGSGGGSANGGLVELETRVGAVRDVPGVQIGPGDMPIGVRPNAVTRLEAPYLFLRSAAPGGKETLVRAVHLPYGQRWVWKLPLAQDDLYSQALPLPAVSAHLVALAYTEEMRPSSGRSQSKTHLVLIERDSGSARERRILPAEMGRSEALELATLGNLLIVRGQSRTMILTGSNAEEQR